MEYFNNSIKTETLSFIGLKGYLYVNFCESMALKESFLEKYQKKSAESQDIWVWSFKIMPEPKSKT